MSLESEYCLIAMGKDPTHIGSLTCDIGFPDLIVTVNGGNYADSSLKRVEVAYGGFTRSRMSLPLSEGCLHRLVVESGGDCPLRGEKIDFKWKDSAESFKREVSRKLEDIRDGRKIVFNSYSTTPTIEKLRELGFFVLGADGNLARKYSNKIFSYNLARELGIGVPYGVVANSFEEAMDNFRNVFSNSEDGVFMTAVRGAGGRSAKHLRNLEEISDFEASPPFLMTAWERKIASPNSQVLISRDRVYYLGLSDQIIVRDVNYFGNIFPSRIDSRSKEEIRKASIKLAEVMRKEGYVGFCGFDWIVTEDGRVLFSEINARKNRSTSILVASLEANRPSNRLSISEMELYASLGMEIGEEDLWEPDKNICWAMRIFKTYGRAKITKDIDPIYDDRSIFDGRGARSSVLNFPERGTFLPGFDVPHDLARIIAVGSDYEEVERLVEAERERIRESYMKIRH